MLVIGRKPVILARRPLFSNDVGRNTPESAALLRKVGHGVWIGPDIRVRVLEVAEGHHGLLVRLGIDAPREVEILRDELKVDR